MREKVRNKYAELALASQGAGEASCCGSSCGCGASAGEMAEVTSTYDPEAIDDLDTQEGREALRRVPAASAFVRATKPEGG